MHQGTKFKELHTGDSTTFGHLVQSILIHQINGTRNCPYPPLSLQLNPKY